jgi:hypothetical protein
MEKAFDDFRRTTAVAWLMLVHRYELLTDEEVHECSADVQGSLEGVNKGWSAPVVLEFGYEFAESS